MACSPFGVRGQLPRQIRAHLLQPVGESRVGRQPLAPLAMTITVSLVDMQPSASTRSKVAATAARERLVQSQRSDHRIGGDHREHGGHARESMPTSWPSTDPVPRCFRQWPSWAALSVVMIASAARLRRLDPPRDGFPKPPAASGHVRRSPMEPVERSPIDRPDAQRLRGSFAV